MADTVGSVHVKESPNDFRGGRFVSLEVEPRASVGVRLSGMHAQRALWLGARP